MDPEILVVGAGVVGAALAYGFARQGLRVIVLDGEDGDLRAARANFGLVWVQGKGAKSPAYHALTRDSADLWPDFLRDLMERSGLAVDYERRGGMFYCLSETDFEARRALTAGMSHPQARLDTRMIDRLELERMMPAVGFGPEVVGASYCEADGHVNPLQLLAALQRAILALGGRVLFRHAVTGITAQDGGFVVQTTSGSFRSPRVVVAAGLATPGLTAPLDFRIPLKSDRGQLLVTERLAPLLNYPASGLRQTADGTVMIGATKETDTDRGVTTASAKKLALRATRIVPALASVRLVRQWSGFRVLPPDGVPIYAASVRHPGLFAAVCHSGITLAAAHAAIVAPAMLDGRVSTDLAAFSTERFDVQKCA